MIPRVLRRRPGGDRRIALCAILLPSILGACGDITEPSGPGERSGPGTIRRNAFDTSTCFWRGPYSVGNPAANRLYIDAGAAYWTARFTLPAGARVFLKGGYPTARYMSFVSYTGVSIGSSLTDVAIQPDSGATNPFIAGNPRDLPDRGYTVELAPGSAPLSGAAPNTVYSGAADRTMTLMYRVYVPDASADITGSAGLPEVVVRNPDGTTSTGAAACAALQPSQDLLAIATPNAVTYQLIRAAALPAPVPVWGRERYAVYLALHPTNFFPLPDNAYLEATLSRTWGAVAVVSGRLPATPRTLPNAAVMGTGDLRYWSLCSYEFVSQKVTACLHDQTVRTDADGDYVIAVSRAADRPANANAGCGLNWLQWSDAGDGAPFGPLFRHPNDGMLLLRNLLADPSFTQSIQNVTVSATAGLVMGPYLPSITYMSRQQFESEFGCDP